MKIEENSEWWEESVRVRYAETDAMGVAHHANYFIWFEAARASYIRSKGLDYNKMEQEGLFMPIVEAKCRYKLPARYDDLLAIRIKVVEIKRSLLKCRYQVFNQTSTALIAEGETINALMGKDGKLKSFSTELLSAFKK